MNKMKKTYFMLMLISVFLVSTLCFSYAFFTSKTEGNGKLNIVAGTLDYKIESDELENNQITLEANTIKEITIDVYSLNNVDSKYELYYSADSDLVDVGYSDETKDVSSGEIDANSSKKINIIIRNNDSTSQTITFGVEGGLINKDFVLSNGTSILEYNTLYVESLLNGATPVLTDNLVPITISDNGIAKKANLYTKWYSYENKLWANAVVLKDTSVVYNTGDVIPEENIESYFVWIPKYSYQLWDLGTYTGLTSISSSERTINIRFGLDNTSDEVTGECTTPGTAGESGNCSVVDGVGDYMTHPAFLAFDTNGFWVGKFETGYDGATASTTTEMNTYDKDKIIIKPNVYSWRNNTLGNMFKASLEYLSDYESHMMKNTEWGAVAYLQHSKYGSSSSVRVNNNSAYITGYAAVEEPTKGYNAGTSIDGNRNESTEVGVDGTYTVNYLNTQSAVASTTGNYTGIYDMSGGAWEYVMGYATFASTVGGSSGITSLYSTFFTDSSYSKYYDKYSSTKNINYNNRILGDATGEMGPFGSEVDPDNITRRKSSWYGDYANFAYSAYPWFGRGGSWHFGSSAGAFAFSSYPGGADAHISFRIVLAP